MNLLLLLLAVKETLYYAKIWLIDVNSFHDKDYRK